MGLVPTSEPGLSGLGCATFTQRPRTVETAVNQYLRPFLIGKDPLAIEDVWQSSFVSSYWRNGPVLGNALSGVDMALWDILGKRTGVPVYQLFGGKCRRAVPTYTHAGAGTFAEVTQAVRRAIDRGYRYVRAQVAIPGLSTYGSVGAVGTVELQRILGLFLPDPPCGDLRFRVDLRTHRRASLATKHRNLTDVGQCIGDRSLE